MIKRQEQKHNARTRLQWEHWHMVSVLLMIYDALAVCGAYFLALWLRFDCRFSMIPDRFWDPYIRFIGIYVVFTEIVFWSLRLYNSIWRFASFSELFRTVGATGITVVCHIIGLSLLYGRMPISYYVFGAVIQFVLTLGIRYSYRLVTMERTRSKRNAAAQAENIMLIGAGDAGRIILRDIRKSSQRIGTVKCIIDDNPNKWGRYIEGIPVVGGRNTIMSAAKKYDIKKIFMAIPSASAKNKRDILEICKETGCELKNLPGVYQLYTGEIVAADLKAVAIEDLLGREPIHVDLEQIFHYLSSKTVMITGAAGSIGSELARQIAAHRPKRLIIFDIYENSTYELQLELRENHPELNFETIIGSVRDSRKLDEVFSEYKPDVVFHAAAHKHVPLMENSPCEAIKNNTVGTYKTAYAAMLHGCKRFVLISTDKAVNPTNIMGASKRLCEMVIQSFDAMIKSGRAKDIPNLFTHAGLDADEEQIMGKLSDNVSTEFVAVRFGNVLGSNGSVIPIFKKQIEKGGPVTVTHPDIIRYFMTIPEAVSLVLQATAFAEGGEIFVLDMGSAVKIDTLARNLIRLSGLKPDVDIKIEYTGLRPGEKLYEEKLMAEEGVRKTSNDQIYIGAPIPFETDEFLNQLEKLMFIAYDNDAGIKEYVAQIVTTYHPAGKEGSEEKGKAYEAQMYAGTGV